MTEELLNEALEFIDKNENGDAWVARVKDAIKKRRMDEMLRKTLEFGGTKRGSENSGSKHIELLKKTSAIPFKIG